MELRVLGAQDAGGQQRSIDRAGLADCQGGHRNTGRHLHDGQQRIHAREHRRLHRHTEHRQVGLGRTHAWQVRRTAGTGDDHLDATGFCFIGILEQQIRGAVGRDHFHFIRNAEFFQHIGGVAKGGPIGLGAHDHANQCTHRRASSLWAPAGASKKQQATREIRRGLVYELRPVRPAEGRAVYRNNPDKQPLGRPPVTGLTNRTN